MITEENTIKITATFSDDRKHRYSLRREWGNGDTAKTATIIMSNASRADLTRGDLTSLLVQNNLSALGYSSVTCVNLFSFMCQKLDLLKDVNVAELTNEDNEKQIVQAVKDADICIVAIGTLSKTYKRARVYQDRLFSLLREFQDKIHVISAPCGTEELHPLSGKLRADGSWTLTPYKLPDPAPVDNEDSNKKGKSKKNAKGNNQAKPDNVIPITSQ